MKLKRTLWVALAGVVLAAAGGIGICFAYFLTPTQYCLLLFGPNAETRVWVEVHGKTIYVHRDTLDSPAERISIGPDAEVRDLQIVEPNGENRYVITSLSIQPLGDPPKLELMVYLDVKGPVEFRQYCDVELRADPADAAVAHFDGPLTIGPRTINWKLPDGLKLVTGDKPTDLFANIGTMDAERGCWVVVQTHMRTHESDKPEFPEGVFPMVEVEFPPKSSGEDPITRQYSLDKFC